MKIGVVVVVGDGDDDLHLPLPRPFSFPIIIAPIAARPHYFLPAKDENETVGGDGGGVTAARYQGHFELDVIRYLDL